MSNYSNKIEGLKAKVNEYMQVYDAEFVRYYINHNCKNEVDKKLIGSNLILNNSFIFDDEWDMEQCKIPYLNRDLDWNFTPNGDEEWVFMLNRHEYFEKLIAAYYFSNDEKYLDKLKELIFNWIEKNEIKECGGPTIRTIDTGIRCFSWMKSLLHLIHENKLEDEEILKIISSIKEQLEYLKNLILINMFLAIGEYYRQQQ